MLPRDAWDCPQQDRRQHPSFVQMPEMRYVYIYLTEMRGVIPSCQEVISQLWEMLLVFACMCWSNFSFRNNCPRKSLWHDVRFKCPVVLLDWPLGQKRFRWRYISFPVRRLSTSVLCPQTAVAGYKRAVNIDLYWSAVLWQIPERTALTGGSSSDTTLWAPMTASTPPGKSSHTRSNHVYVRVWHADNKTFKW